MATLTGAIMTTFGSGYAGLFGTDDDWCEQVRAAGDRAGELLWRLPLHETYADAIKGKYADIANAVEDRKAGSERSRILRMRAGSATGFPSA